MTAGIVLYCTGRGRHRRRYLYVLTDAPGGLALHRLTRGAGPSAATDAELVDTIGAGWSGIETPLDRPLSCPACPRSPQLNGDTWRTLYDGLHAAGESDVDITDLPF